MTYEKLIGAVPAFQKLVTQELPLPVAYKLSKMVRRVNEELVFFRSENEKIREKHEDPNSPGIMKEQEDLLNLDVEWNIPPVKIKLNDNLYLSCSDIDAFNGFIEFIDKDNEE